MTQKLAPPFDEIVLSLGGTHVEENGQLTLFYDDSTEPPDPDDYPSVEAYNSAWQCWSERNPQLLSEVQGMSDDGNGAEEELKIGSRFGSKYADITYTLIAIRDRGPKPYTFQADDGTKIHCRHWDAQFKPIEDIEFAPQQFQHANINACDAPNPDYCVGEQVTTPDTVNLLVGEQVTAATAPDTVNLLVGEQVTTDTKKTAPQHDATHWVEEYWVERSGNKYWYYRYMYMTGRKIHRIYIGSVMSVLAQRKKVDVVFALADGQTPSEIEKLIRQELGVRS